MLTAGMAFPDFTLPNQNGKVHSLGLYRGQWLVIYFYPKDNTSGCTLEARDFERLAADFAAQKAAVAGVSADTVKSHCNFAAKLSLRFPLLSDPDHALLEATGVWQKKKLAGREYMGTVRATFLTDPQGIIRAVWPKVKTDGHAQAVLAELAKLKGEAP